MAEITVTFPDGKTKQYPAGVRVRDILSEINGRISREAIAAKYDERWLDLSAPLTSDGKLVFITADSAEGMNIFWHSSAHVMAHAIKSLFPQAKFAFGPPVEDGFYYDVDIARPLTPEDLQAIEKKMAEIVKADLPFVREDLDKAEALKLFKSLGETYKLEQIERLNEPPSIYREGDFVDLCRGPHLPSTGAVKYFKLLSVAGAYWLGDEKNPMLQRVYGVAFSKKAQLDEYLLRLEEAKKRDHRRLGKELDLYSINEEIGAGLILWHPKGAFIRYKIEEFWKQEHLKAGYEFVNTPHIARANLWSTSGHLDFFHENMFSPMVVDEVEYLIKPMNCPFHLQIYKNSMRSYRDLPLRWAELGTVYRYERSGVLHGLLRVRGFTQDDAHLICRPDQLDAEISRVLDFCLYMLRSFGFESYDVYLSTRPANAVGTVENWQIATEALKNALERAQVEYQVDPGEGVFYGPKIDIKIRDRLGRTWQCSTIQVDFNEPERFDITYIGQDGNRHRPIMLHRALLGSLERFFGVLIEHYAGAFPLWLAPVQAIVLPITEKQAEYGRTVFETLHQQGLRVQLDDRSEKVGYKIREAETQKIPYMLVLGQKEVDTNTVSLRKHKEGDCGVHSVQSVVDEIKEKERTKG
ncbi:MAG TPA: threonine--tRNA ligase [bacterium]|nr:threonine--tRNA ligase [bacterium]HPN33265.1 threonine--tRNA ligase [bacterium]